MFCICSNIFFLLLLTTRASSQISKQQSCVHTKICFDLLCEEVNPRTKIYCAEQISRLSCTRRKLAPRYRFTLLIPHKPAFKYLEKSSRLGLTVLRQIPCIASLWPQDLGLMRTDVRGSSHTRTAGPRKGQRLQ